MNRLSLFRVGLSIVAGAAAAAFVLPASRIGAVAAFGLVQILFALRSGRRFSRDRFRESQQTAERILEKSLT